MLKVWSLSSCTYKTLDNGSDDWTPSATASGSYYYDTDLEIKPVIVTASGIELEEISTGPVAGQWAYGDFDTIGSERLYINLTEGDPDSQPTGHIKCSEPKEVLQAASDKETGLRGIFVSNFSTEQATIWLYRTDSSDVVKFRALIVLSANQSPFVWNDLFVLNSSDKLKIQSSVEDVCIQVNGVEK